MPVGAALTADYQFELNLTGVYGAGTNGVWFDRSTAVDGLGVPDAKTQDVVWNQKDGSYANPDYVQLRVITIPVVLRGAVPATVLSNAKALMTAWGPVIADVSLAFQLPGWNKFSVNGRPRGAKLDLAEMDRGAVRALLRFDCPDPTITYL